MPGQRRPTSKTSLTTLVSTTEQTTIEVFKPEEIPDDWYQYLEQYLVPVAGTAVAIIAIRANDSLVNWMVSSFLRVRILIKLITFLFQVDVHNRQPYWNDAVLRKLERSLGERKALLCQIPQNEGTGCFLFLEI